MLTVTIDTKGAIDFLAGIKRDQLPFVAALALTKTANDAKAEMPTYLETVIQRPRPFTKSATYIKAATKRNLVATVGLKDIQAKYLGPLIRGSSRGYKPVEQKFMGRYFVPARSMTLDQYGNVSKRTQLAILKAAAEHGRYRGKPVFVLPRDVGVLPAGVYLGDNRGGKPTLLLLFVDQAPSYKRQIGLREQVEKVVAKRFAANFTTAFASALGSLR